MATIKLYRYEILITTAGAFTAGDIIEVFIDDTLVQAPASPFSFVSTGMTVELNGVSYPQAGSDSLPTLVANGFTYFNVQKFNDNFCFETYLVKHFGNFFAWPYAYYYTEADHFSCAVNPPACDLAISGIPSVVPASDSTTADGSITVVATSTYPIEGSLEPFVYGDGSSTLIFSGLLAGTYVVYLRDSKNCQVNIQVVVPYDNTYGAFYRMEYYDFTGIHTKIDITKRGYSDAVTEIKAGSSPIFIDLRGEGSTDKFEPVLASQARVTLTSETDLQFQTLYTNDRNLYRVQLYKDYGSGYELVWLGKILPFLYSEELKAPPYYINAVASDGLPELKDFYLVTPDSQKYFGTQSLIKIVAYCLSQIKTGLGIRCAVNMYATDMDQTASDDPFDQAYVDYETFYLSKQEPDLDFVLQSILETFTATIIQWGGYWNIVRREEALDSYDYREFDSDGDYVTNGSYNPVKNIEVPSANGIMWTSTPNMEMRQGYGNIKVVYKLGLKPNIIDNGDFRLRTTYFQSENTYSFSINTDGFSIVNGGYPMTQGYEKIDDGNVAFYISAGEDILENTSGGEAYIQTQTYSVKMGTNNQLKINIRYKIKKASVTFSGTVYSVEVPYIKVRMRVKYGSLYLQNDGSWTSTATILTFFVTTLNEYVESEIIASQPVTGTPVAGMNFDIRLYHAYAYHVDFQTQASLEALVTYSGGASVLPTGYKTQLRDDFTLPSVIRFYELEETTAATSGYSVIEPDDWHTTNNPRKWILKYSTSVGTLTGANIFPFYVDRIKVTYLTDGKAPIDSIVRYVQAETLNKDRFEKTVILGSYSNLIVTSVGFTIDLGSFFPGGGGVYTTTTNTLVADLIYTGWLRDSSGAGYEYWKRDAFAESDKLHGIFLKSYAAQYSASWKLLRGKFVCKAGTFGLLDVINDTNYGEKIYVPVSLSIDDKNCMTDGEFLELAGTPGEDTSEESGPSFTSGFTSGFGSSFN